MRAMKTKIAYPDELRCKGCGAKYEINILGEEMRGQVIDRAVSAGWRVAWTPSEPSWCPQCWNSGQKRTTYSIPQEYDVPLWD